MKNVLMVLLAIFCFIGGCIPWTYTIVAGMSFDANCGDYLRLAADANNIDTAEERITTAIEYLEEKGLTSGHTKIINYYPKNDIGMWYDNLKTAQTQLQEIQSREYTELEESNMLMKLRETILDDDGHLTAPLGIGIADNFSVICWLNILLWVPCWFIGVILIYVGTDLSEYL